MLEYRFKTIEKWPQERTEVRQSSPFRALWGKTQRLLERELRHLEAENVVLQADCDDSQIRISDGMLRADAKLKSPGIILSFDSKYGPLSYPCDTFGHYQENVRAIALALEALRKVKRYGVGQRGEQYKGWGKLPDLRVAPRMTLSEAVDFIALHGAAEPAGIRDDPDALKRAYRATAKHLHPDAGGSVEEFSQLTEAKQIVEDVQAAER